MKFANRINNLVVRFIRLDFEEALAAEMLVMERLYAIDYRAYEIEKRALWFDVFEDELMQLHKGGFVHRDIKRPSSLTGFYFDNILLTNEGLRLIDTGISALQQQVGEVIFKKYIAVEKEEMQLFKTYFLNR